ncbi:Glutaredoxin-related protein [Lachnospiraceae bacterium]|nr:Glutaredoxin-related protein [Lachnospiraceae bacterium]
MLKVYGSRKCPDCTEIEKNFNELGIEYEFADITEELADLKAFLKIRDTDTVFDPIRGTGGIGIPACVDEDGQIFLDWKSYLKKLGKEPVSMASNGASCSIDGKGC